MLNTIMLGLILFVGVALNAVVWGTYLHYRKTVKEEKEQNKNPY